MRFLLSLLFVVAATALFCHGLFLESEARTALAGAERASEFGVVGATWPYSRSAATARGRLLEIWKTRPPERRAGDAFEVGLSRFRHALRDDPPWMHPPAAAAIGLLGLLLALFLPRQRGRSLVLLALLAGAAVASPLLMGQGLQAEVVDGFPPYARALRESGWVAIGCLLAAGLFLAAGRPRRRRDDD